MTEKLPCFRVDYNRDREKAQAIINSVAEMFDIERSRIIALGRRADVVLARHAAMFLIRRSTDLSLMAIGEIFLRDHGTVLHARERIISQRSFDRRLDAVMNRLEAEFPRIGDDAPANHQIHEMEYQI